MPVNLEPKRRSAIQIGSVPASDVDLNCSHSRAAQSQPAVKSNEFLSNTIAVSAYQKKKVFGGVHVTIRQNTFIGNEKLYETDAFSSLSLVDSVYDEGASVIDE